MITGLLFLFEMLKCFETPAWMQIRIYGISRWAFPVIYSDMWCMYIYLSVWLSVCRSFICSFCLYIIISFYLSSFVRSIIHSIYLSFYPCHSVCLSVSLSSLKIMHCYPNYKSKLLYPLEMCNSDRVLEYSAVTAMIDHENDDRRKNNSDWL